LDETGKPAPRIANANLLYDTIIEVIDLQAGRIVTSRRFPAYLRGGFMAGQRIHWREVDDAGNVKVRIQQLALKGYSR
jgi:hypothetical protein